MRVDALGLLANKTVARIADKVVPCSRGFQLNLAMTSYLEPFSSNLKILCTRGLFLVLYYYLDPSTNIGRNYRNSVSLHQWIFLLFSELVMRWCYNLESFLYC